MSNMKLFKANRLYCFSPLVMMITFLIEVTAAVYTVWRYKMNDVTKLVVAILGGLAVFQLALVAQPGHQLAGRGDLGGLLADA